MSENAEDSIEEWGSILRQGGGNYANLCGVLLVLLP